MGYELLSFGHGVALSYHNFRVIPGLYSSTIGTHIQSIPRLPFFFVFAE
jgi:hypothetical protein